MKPVDKFGRELYPRIFKCLEAAGRGLEAMGYSEHPGHFNLFSRMTPQITFYADMRGTEDVPIWKVPVPLFFFQRPPSAIEPIKEFAFRAALIEAQRLSGIDLRLAFPLMEELSIGGPFASRLHDHFEEVHARIFSQYPWQPRMWRSRW